MTQTTAPIGWGIIGTADGFQWSSEGIDKELSLASTYWDLPSDIAVVFPAPDAPNSLVAPLYCFSNLTLGGNQQVSAVCQYFPIRQQGSHRPGTFFGSFIEVIDKAFTGNEAKAIFNGLKKLSHYQYKHFIDSKNSSYHSDIRNQPFDNPVEELEAIYNQLQAVRHSQLNANEEFMFIHFKNDDELRFLFSLIIRSGLNQQYQKIYFSSSDIIAQNVKSKLNQEIFTTNNIELVYKLMQPRVLEFQKMYEHYQTQFEHQKLHLENLRIQNEQEVKERGKLVAIQVKPIEDEKIKLEKENMSLKNQLAQQNQLSQFAEMILDQAVKFAPAKFGQLGENIRHQEQLQEQNQYLEERLRTLQSEQSSQIGLESRYKAKIDELDEQLKYVNASRKNLSTYNLLFGGLSLILFIGLMVFAGLYFWNNDKKYSQDEFDKKMKTEQDQWKEKNPPKTITLSPETGSLKENRLVEAVIKECSNNPKQRCIDAVYNLSQSNIKILIENK